MFDGTYPKKRPLLQPAPRYRSAPAKAAESGVRNQPSHLMLNVGITRIFLKRKWVFSVFGYETPPKMAKELPTGGWGLFAGFLPGERMGGGEGSYPIFPGLGNWCLAVAHAHPGDGPTRTRLRARV